MNIWPYTNFHEMNLDWILQAIKDMNEELRTFINVNTIKYADPIKWDITRQYEANTVVVDDAGTAYLSVKAVPSGISISRTEYWTEIGNFSKLWISFKTGITPYDVGASTTATDNYPVNTLVWVKDTLRIVTKAMTAGDKFTDSNSTLTSMNAELEKLRTRMTLAETNLAKEITDRKAADETLTNLVNKNANDIAAEIKDRKAADKDVQKQITNAENYTNALTIGVVLNSEQAAGANTTALNLALSSGTVVFIPQGKLYINAPLIIRDGAGLVGYSADESMIIQLSPLNGVEVPVEYLPANPTKVETCVTLRNVRIYGVNSTGIGLRLYNYTYEVTCNNNGNAYKELKGNSYGLEYRNSDFSNIQITGFNTGLSCGTGTGVIKVIGAFIDTCGGIGFTDNSADSEYTNFSITYCKSAGLSANTVIANKYTNIKVYQNGKSSGNGCTFYNCHNVQITAMNAEENSLIGVQFIDCRECTIDIIAASNGYGSNTSDDYAKTGVAFTNCYNMVGNVVACDKNAAYFSGVATQTYGITSNTVCGRINYAEYANLKSYNDSDDNVKQSTAIADDTVRGKCKGANNVTINTDFINFFEYNDNEYRFSARAVINSVGVPTGNWVLIMDALNTELAAKMKRTFSKRLYVTDFIAVGSDNKLYPLRYTADTAVIALATIPGNIELSISLDTPYSYL